ncbi:HTH-type transcriptional regulator YesS [compost metagenome]
MQRLRLEVRAGISPSFHSLPELPEAFRLADKVIAEGRLNVSGPLIRHAEDPAGPPGPELLTSFDLQAIRQAMASGSAKDARNLVNDYLVKLEGSQEVTVGQVHQELVRILDAAVAEMKGLASLHPSVFNPEGIPGILDAGEVRRLLTGWMEAVEAFGTSRKEPESAPVIQQMITYLDLHYFEDISLIDAATRFHLDPSYLSKLFKSVTGENFIEYLTRRRIEKACELLRTSDRRISDISELVGYENQRYFSQVFKKSTGQTPSEYREMHPEPS